MDVANDQFVDTFTGGAGHDEYRTLDLNTLRNGTAEDIITDFEAGDGGDRIIVYNNGSAANPFDDGTRRCASRAPIRSFYTAIRTAFAAPVLRLKNVDATTLTAYNLGGLAFPVVAAVNIDDNDQGNTLAGSQEGDRIYGHGGADTIDGYDGNDSLAGGADADIIRGDLGDDWIAGQEGRDLLYGEAGNDTISGGTGDDVIYGDDTAGTLTGNDHMSGDEGDDTLVGGRGDDIYYFAVGDGRDRLDDIAGTDRIVFGAGSRRPRSRSSNFAATTSSFAWPTASTAFGWSAPATRARGSRRWNSPMARPGPGRTFSTAPCWRPPATMCSRVSPTPCPRTCWSTAASNPSHWTGTGELWGWSSHTDPGGPATIIGTTSVDSGHAGVLASDG